MSRDDIISEVFTVAMRYLKKFIKYSIAFDLGGLFVQYGLDPGVTVSEMLHLASSLLIINVMMVFSGLIVTFALASLGVIDPFKKDEADEEHTDNCIEEGDDQTESITDELDDKEEK